MRFSVFRWAIHGLFLILLLLRWDAAISGNVVVERSWVEDQSGHMTLAQAMAVPQQQLTGAYFGQGFSASAFWIRLRIDPKQLPNGRPEDPMVIRLRPVFIDEFQLFDPLSPQERPRYTGDRHAWSEDEYQSLNNNFLIPLGAAPRDVWLRLKTNSSSLSSIEILELKEAQSMDWGQLVLSAIFLAVLLVCMGWGLLSWLASRDKLILRYMVREVFMLAYAFNLLGGWRTWGGHWLSTEWIDWSSSLVFCTSGPALIWFDIHFFQKFHPKPLLLKSLKWMFLIFLTGILMAVLGQPQLALRIHATAAAIGAALVLLTALTLRVRTNNDEFDPGIPKWAVVSTYIFMMFLGGSNRLVASGILPGNYDAFYLVLLYPLVGSLLMMALLQLRANRMNKEQQEAKIRAQSAELLALQEKERRLEQQQFMAMLGHELRNPLSAVNFLADADTAEGQKIRQAVQDMTQVIERSVQAGRLDDADFKPQLNTLAVPEFVRDLCKRLPQDRVLLRTQTAPATMQTDKLLLQIVLGNLLDNALKYGDPSGTVLLDCEAIVKDGAALTRWRVANVTGPSGLPLTEHLFQKYYRSPKVHHHIGSGLGLYLVKGLVTTLGGTIEYTPMPEGELHRVVFEVIVPG
jgi:signal transduction histidine kinase